MNWWVQEVSDPVAWDVDGLGILDPRQMAYVLEQCEVMQEYGFDVDLVEGAFLAFAIEKEEKDGCVRLVRTSEAILEDNATLFALPDLLDEEKGPYADLLEAVTRGRVKLLNDLIDFEQNFTIDELEEAIRDRQNQDYMEGRAVHPFAEISAILEFTPDGYELEGDEEEGEEEDLDDIPDFDEPEEKIEEDETMKWDEDEEEEEDDFDELEDSPENEDDDDR